MINNNIKNIINKDKDFLKWFLKNQTLITKMLIKHQKEFDEIVHKRYLKEKYIKEKSNA